MAPSTIVSSVSRTSTTTPSMTARLAESWAAFVLACCSLDTSASSASVRRRKPSTTALPCSVADSVRAAAGSTVIWATRNVT